MLVARSARARRRRGFALFTVVLLLAIMTAAVALSFDDAVSSLQSAGGVRASEMIKGALEQGVSNALLRVQQEDVSTLIDPPVDWDLFQGPVPESDGRDFVPAMDYPTAGPYANQFRVRIGLRPGQRARAPAGEDVRNAYGQIVEVQVGVEARGAGIPPAEERVTIGVLVPRLASHSN
jgi:hypothetical protein